MGFDRVSKLFEKPDRNRPAGVYARPHAEPRLYYPDEAQNTTPEQMKMFLTRIGFGSKAVITGDVTQIDLARHQRAA